MNLAYYKFIVKDYFIQSLRIFKLRRKNYIGRSCRIKKDCILEGNNVISDYVYLLENILLKKNVSVGMRSVLANLEVGENSFIDCGVLCTGFGDGKIVIGENSYIGINNILDWSSNLTIGKFVHIAGPSTGLWTHSSANMVLNNLGLENLSTKERYKKPVVVEDNVYIGGNCTIYPGITIGHHSIVAPNSAVTKDVEPYTMVGGIPAKLIKKVNTKENN